MIRTEIARERADQLVDRRALLRSRSEVEAAQRRVGVVARRLEDAGQEIDDGALQRRHLAREAEDLGARGRVVLVLQSIRQPLVQPLDQRVVFRRHVADHVAGLVGGLEGMAPDHAALRLGQRAEELVEAGDEVGLGEDGIDREIDLQALMQFEQAGADRVGMGGDLLGARGQQVLDADRDEDAVDRLARAIGLEQVEEGEPARFLRLGVGVLRGVAAGGVDQHRILGEPPVAIARAARAGDGRGRGAAGQREFQAGIDQCRGLAGAGRADDDVPGQVVEIVAALAARALQRGERVLHSAGEGGAVAGFLLFQCLGQRGGGLAAADDEDRDPGERAEHQQHGDGQPDPEGLERTDLAESEEGTAEPDQRGEREPTDQDGDDAEPGGEVHARPLSSAAGSGFRRAGSGRGRRRCCSARSARRHPCLRC